MKFDKIPDGPSTTYATVSEGLGEAIRKAEARLEEIASQRSDLAAEEAELRKMLNQPEPRRRHRRKEQVEEAE